MPQLLDELEQRMQAPGAPQAFPLLHFSQDHKVARLTPEQAGAMDAWFFIGDLHGDFFALHTLLRRAEALRPDCRILFLGDMVDRGVMPLECVFLLLDWGLRHPGRLAWIAGNHDTAFSYDEQGVFTSVVSPAELLQELNARDLLAGTRQRIGRFFVDMARRLPRALLFPDGLLATHGGFPLSDLHAQGQAITDEQAYLDWLNTEACLKDFTWARINRAPKKLPDRYSSGSQYGFKDFEAFCQLQPQWFPVTHMVTGHEHPREGFDLHPNYKINRALTLVGLGFDDYLPAPASYQKYAENLYLGQGVAGDVPCVVPVPVEAGELDMFMPSIAAASPAPAVVSAAVPAPPQTPLAKE